MCVSIEPRRTSVVNVKNQQFYAYQYWKVYGHLQRTNMWTDKWKARVSNFPRGSSNKWQGQTVQHLEKLQNNPRATGLS